jgi:NAD(P) transhydrogenase
MTETIGSAKHYDMVVIGSGAAGHHGAIQAAKLGKKVLVVERSKALGGTSINTGTIPSKTLREAVLRSTRSGSADRRISASDLAQRIEEVASNEVRVFENQFHRNEIDVSMGTASFSGPHTIRVANQEGEYFCHADYILIASGSRPAHNDAIPVDDVSIIDTNAIRRLRTEHHVLTIVGGGVIGIEYACIASALDIPVTVIERRPQILDFVDQEIVEALSYHMRSQGVTFRLGEEVTKSSEGKVGAKLKSGKQIWSDVLLYAVGRQANTDSLNLAACGLAANERGRIQVNANFQTSQPHIYAAGDVIGFPSLSSVSMEQGRLAACHAFAIPVVSVPELFP